jgi:N-acetylmuramoyl-L-alanine amidase
VTLLSATPSAAAAALPSADDKHISVYSSVAIYTLPVLDRAGHEYVGLLELLEPLGRVSSQPEGQRWKLRFNTVEAEFSVGKTRAKVHGRNFDFAAPFLMENARGLVPLSSLGTLLPRFLGTAINFHESARRLLVGDVAIQTSVRLDAGNPPRLLLSFSAPVDPAISTEPGKLRMIFKRDPVVSPASSPLSFDNKVITRASYSENNGDAEFDVTANEPLLASFSGDRKTIEVSAVPPAAVVNAKAATPSAAAAQNPAQTSRGANATAGSRRLLAAIDPAHGGEERGAALTETLAEKDVTLGFARMLRHELETRGFAVVLLRDGDNSSTPEQRAAAANVARAAIYIGLHATSQGNGARVYTALLPVEGPGKGAFHAWNAAQAPALPASKIVAAAIVAEMKKREFPILSSSASLRPLNNVVMPAVAVELAPGADGAADLTSANYQQQAASAIADAIVSVRERLGAQP